MKSKETKIALIYDFDHTLSTTDMQDYSFLPLIGASAKDFWGEVNELSKKTGMDPLLSYMLLMIRKTNEKNIPLTRKQLVSMGKNVVFFKGLDTWFNRINNYGKKKNLKIEHFIISSGNKEIIEGSSLYKYFKEVYACEFYYENSIAIWPKTIVNYTTKTQFIFRINKGVLDIHEHEKVNASMKDEDKDIPLSNMIYIADGLTDVPCMKLVRMNNGVAIAVYKKSDTKVADNLLKDKRVDYIAEADYSQNSRIETIVKSIIDKIASIDHLNKLRNE